MAYVKIRLRRGTSAQWEYANPVLSEGEVATECPDEGVGTGLINIKVGDGITPWMNLPYAFEAKNTAQSITEALEDISELKETTESHGRTLSEITETMTELRRIDIAAEEPAEPVLGMVWIDTDVVQGSLVLDPTTCSLQVGAEQRINCVSTLSQVDEIRWDIVGDETVVSIVEKSSLPSNPFCKIAGMISGIVKVRATAVYDGKGIYTATCTANVVQQGSLTVTPQSMRLVSGRSSVLSLTVNENLPYDRIQWVTSNDNVTLSNQSETGCTVTAARAGGQCIVYARAIYNGQTIYTTSCTIMTVGMALSTTAVSVTAGRNTSLMLTNSMLRGTDYDTITWTSSDPDIASVLTSNDTSATVTAARAGQATIAVIASLSGTTVQRVQCTVVVTGELILDQSSRSIGVGETFGLRLTNTLGSNEYDEIRWQSTRSDIVIIQDSTSTTAMVKGIGAGTGVISAVAYKDNVAIGIEGTASCTVTVAGAIAIPVDTPKKITVGNSIDILATCTLNATEYTAIQWTTNNSSSVSIVYNGLQATITGVAAGDAEIRVMALYNGSIVSDSKITVQCENAAPVGTMSINPASTQLKIGSRVTLSLNNTYVENVDYDTIRWSVDLPSSAVVVSKTNTSALIEGLAVGPVTVTAQAMLGGVYVDGAVATADVIVTGDITINKNDLNAVQDMNTNIIIGATNGMYAGVYDRISWTSSDSEIGEITSSSDTTCAVSFRKAGNVTITVTATKNGDTVSTDSFAFTVDGYISIDTSNISDPIYTPNSKTAAVINALASGTWDEFTWTSSDENVARATGDNVIGTITAVGAGQATITLTAKKNNTAVKTATATVTVIDTDISIGNTNITGNHLLTSTDGTIVVNANDPDVTFDTVNAVSSDSNIASVTKVAVPVDLEDNTVNQITGFRIGGVAEGSATISITATNSNGTYTASYNVDVEDAHGIVVDSKIAGNKLTTGNAGYIIINTNWSGAVLRNEDAQSDDTNVATVTVETTIPAEYQEALADGEQAFAVNITGVAEGTATITLSAEDDDDTYTATFTIEVEDTRQLTLDNKITGNMQLNDTGYVIVDTNWPDANFTSTSAVAVDATVAGVSVVAVPSEYQATVTGGIQAFAVQVNALAAGTTAVNITAEDSDGEIYTQRFEVTVDNV